MRAVNLIPADQRESSGSLTGSSGGAALMVVVLVAGLAVMAFLYGSAKHDESSSRNELAKVQTELSSARAQAGRAAPYTSFITMANQRVQYFSQLVAARFDWSHAFNELGRVLPKDATLTSLHGQVGAAGSSSSSSSSSSATSASTPTSATPAGSTPLFSLSGCATTQSEVAQTLQRLRLMDGVSTVELQSSTKSGSSSAGGSSASSSAAGACPQSAAVFTVQVTFVGLPNPPATVTTANQSGASR
jgi:Tfp pilus assembly protein PilN